MSTTTAPPRKATAAFLILIAALWSLSSTKVVFIEVNFLSFISYALGGGRPYQAVGVHSPTKATKIIPFLATVYNEKGAQLSPRSKERGVHCEDFDENTTNRR